MSNTKTQLEVNDIVYRFRRSELRGRHVIERVTATQAITDGIRLRRELSGYGTTSEIGSSTWRYELETEAIKLQWERMELISVLSSAAANTPKLSIVKLRKLAEIIKSTDDEQQ